MIRFGVHTGGQDFWSIKSYWQEADRLGFFACSMADHPSWKMLETWTVFASVAALTERLHLCPLVLATGHRHAPWLAYQAASLDVISNGRVILGIGAGWNKAEHMSFGLPFPRHAERVARLEEALLVCKKMWTEENAHFEGRFYVIRAPYCPRPVQQPHPPIMVGGWSESLMRIAARHAQVWNASWDDTLEEFASRRARFAEICREVGRRVNDIELSLAFIAYVGTSTSEVEDALRLQAEREGKSVTEFKTRLRGALVGTPEQIIERLRRFEQMGVSLILVLLRGIDRVETMRLFASSVLPAFAR
jgi:alkanesulfonate monooxygenase SsuD/methylene tetrahydromethanopterin reductase-like flavin-dependent oxidoreductase (luciferase family)